MEKIKVYTIENDEEYLRQVSAFVDLNDSKLEDDIRTLEQFCKKEDVLAMAAVQLGIPKRLLYLKNTTLELIEKMQFNSESEEERNYNEAKVLINPVITLREGLTDYWENCRSCLNNMGHVRRPYKIAVEYYDTEGILHSDTFEGFEATVLSHEMDHLDGILHIDIADEVLVLPQEERKKFRQTHGYNIVSKTGDYYDLLHPHQLTKSHLTKK